MGGMLSMVSSNTQMVCKRERTLTIAIVCRDWSQVKSYLESVRPNDYQKIF
jgi:hypothetical protein